MIAAPHQFIDRRTGTVRTERLYRDRVIRRLYSATRESSPRLFRLATSSWSSALLGYLAYDMPFAGRLAGQQRFLAEAGVDLNECLDPVESLDTPRRIFERRIRYWDCRPMTEDPRAVVSPADARLLLGSFRAGSSLFVKDKFFTFGDLLAKREWLAAFAHGDWAILRLTPDKYHYNHTPVAGIVRDRYAIDGAHHSCNPAAVIAVATPYSKNQRHVVVIDTDVPGGTGVGLVAMIEVVALMIGEIVACYSEERYDAPEVLNPGRFVRRGQPKSLYRPGSSTDILLFQRGRVRFEEDLVRNQQRTDVASRFTLGFGTPLVETEVRVRETIARATEVAS